MCANCHRTIDDKPPPDYYAPALAQFTVNRQDGSFATQTDRNGGYQNKLFTAIKKITPSTNLYLIVKDYYLKRDGYKYPVLIGMPQYKYYAYQYARVVALMSSGKVDYYGPLCPIGTPTKYTDIPEASYSLSGSVAYSLSGTKSMDITSGDVYLLVDKSHNQVSIAYTIMSKVE
jgi:hypothetical protein